MRGVHAGDLVPRHGHALSDVHDPGVAAGLPEGIEAMTTVRHVAAATLVGAALLFAGTEVARAQDADTAEVQRYVLTDAGLAKYSQATQKLAALPPDAAACADDDLF